MTVLIAFLKLIRVSNLIMLTVSQFIFYFIVFQKTAVIIATDNLSFLFLTLSTIFIAAGGYVINDYLDIECDRINKPSKTYIPSIISKRCALNIYYSITSIGVLFSCLLAYRLNNMNLLFLFFGIIGSLYVYSKFLKRFFLIGNILISLLVALNSVIIISLISTPIQYLGGIILLAKFSFFSFYINLIREIVKDMEDMNGDHNVGMKTSPIVLGVHRTKSLIHLISIIPIYFMIRFWIDYLRTNISAQIFYLIFILFALLLFFVKLQKAKSKKDFSSLSMLLKGILLFGLILTFFIIY